MNDPFEYEIAVDFASSETHDFIPIKMQDVKHMMICVFAPFGIEKNTLYPICNMFTKGKKGELKEDWEERIDYLKYCINKGSYYIPVKKEDKKIEAKKEVKQQNNLFK